MCLVFRPDDEFVHPRSNLSVNPLGVVATAIIAGAELITLGYLFVKYFRYYHFILLPYAVGTGVIVAITLLAGIALSTEKD